MLLMVVGETHVFFFVAPSASPLKVRQGASLAAQDCPFLWAGLRADLALHVCIYIYMTLDKYYGTDVCIYDACKQSPCQCPRLSLGARPSQNRYRAKMWEVGFGVFCESSPFKVHPVNP